MNKLLALIKTDINVTFGFSAMKYRFKSIKNSWQIILFLFIGVSFIPFYVMMINLLGDFYDSFVSIGQQPYFLFLGVFMTQIMVFFFGLIYVMSKYYFSNDLEQLVPLPLKPTYIVGSKFVSLMISEYLTTLPIILPFIFIYGIKGGEGIIYWIYALFIVLYIPVLPLSLASILIMLFMKFTNLKGKKDLLRIIGGSISLIIIIFIQFRVQSMVGDPTGEMDFLLNLATNSNLLIERFGSMFPPTMLASLALSNYTNLRGLLNIVIFLIFSDVILLTMIYLSDKIFFSGLIGNNEASGSVKKNNRGKDKKLEYKLRKPYYSIAKKELKMISKIPVYALNSIGGVIIIPIIFLMSFFTGSGDLEMLRPFLHASMDMVVFICIAIIGFLGITNSIGVTTFSREGNNFWIQQILPIKAKDQIFGRTLASLCIQLLGIVVLVASLQLIIRMDMFSIILILMFGILSSIPTTFIGMVIDVSRPKLNWSNPQQAMKQNLNVLIGMAGGIIYLGLMGLLVKQLYGIMDTMFIYAIIAIIFIVSSVVLYKILEGLIIKQMREI